MDEETGLSLEFVLFTEATITKVLFNCAKILTTLYLYVPEDVLLGENYKHFLELLNENPIAGLSCSSSSQMGLQSVAGELPFYLQIELSSRYILIEKVFSFLMDSNLIEQSLAEQSLKKIEVELQKAFKKDLSIDLSILPQQQDSFFPPLGLSSRRSVPSRRHVFPPQKEGFPAIRLTCALEKETVDTIKKSMSIERASSSHLQPQSARSFFLRGSSFNGSSLDSKSSTTKSLQADTFRLFPSICPVEAVNACGSVGRHHP